MSENIQPHKPKLLVVSDTAVYRLNGKQYAFGPVVRELEYLADQFESITWIGYYKKHLVGDPITTEILSPKIKLVQIPGSGGESFPEKLFVLLCLPLVFFTIVYQLFRHDVVHTRGPSVPALLAIILSFVFKQKKWWNKYAGNWDEPSPPFFYRLQQKILSAAKHTQVTINGRWPNQKAHLNSIENPCLNETDIQKGSASSKDFNSTSFTCCFIGALNDDKGVPQIIDLLNNDTLRTKIAHFYFVGDGAKRNEYINSIRNTSNIEFTGFKNRKGVHEILMRSHFILLPSKSEGFPKVIAEASCYGCIPIVSDVSCIGQYINQTNGYLWDTRQSFQALASEALNENKLVLSEKSINFKSLAHLFTYSQFVDTIKRILN